MKNTKSKVGDPLDRQKRHADVTFQALYSQLLTKNLPFVAFSELNSCLSITAHFKITVC